ncbi:hypothetical protein ACIQU7_23780 [Streptomyces albidoflavus]
MNTSSNMSLQLYSADGSPVPRTVSPQHLLDLVCAAYARGGTGLDHHTIDAELYEVADKAACSLLRDRWNDDFPIAAYVELLSAVAALRAVLGLAPTPTAREVTQWSENLERELGSHVGGPTKPSYVRFADGPYRGAVLRLPEPSTPAGAGPTAVLVLPIAWGDTVDPGRGDALYRRALSVSADGLWLYYLVGEVREDARPHITAPATGPGQGVQGGRP